MKHFGILLFALIQFSAFGQKQIFLDTLFYDNFSKADSYWKLAQNEENDASIVDGKLLWKHHGEDNYFTWRKFNELDEDENFKIKMYCSREVGTGRVGIIYGCKDIDNFHFFYLKGDTYYIAHYEDNVYTKRATGTVEELDKTAATTLTVKREGKEYFYYVNNKEVYSEDAPEFFGPSQGMVVGEEETVTVTKYIIEQRRTMLVATDAMYAAKIENVGANVNTTYMEYAPVISPDGKTLFFARKKYPENVGGAEDLQDIYYSSNTNGAWGKAQNIGAPLNNKSPNAALSCTPDGKLLLLNQYDENGGFLDQGFAMTDKGPDGWKNPENLDITKFYDDNQYLEGFMCNDGKTLIITTEMYDSYGDKDVYVSFLQYDGTWSKPLNLGEVVNSSQSEIYPFMASDRKTLYFASYGHVGYGEADIFVTKRLDETWTNWSTPVNLGPPINDDDWDAYFSIDAAGSYAYMVKYKGSIGEGDIVRIKLPPAAKPEPVVLIHGKVYDSKTNKPLGAAISYESLTTGKEVGVATSDPVTGEYQIVLPYGDQYGFRAQAKNHLSVNDNLDLQVKGEYTEINRDLYLEPIVIGATIQLNNVFFERATANLLSTSYPELDRLVKIMQDNPKMYIELAGHTDNQGDQAKNLILSEQRVARVKEYLVSKGIDASRITGKGYGSTKPISPNDTEPHRAKNRRVEFVIIKI